jgi:Vanadium chloroperoxidase N-terminal domain/PAP2 superfamily
MTRQIGARWRDTMEPSVQFWNDLALECNRLDHFGPMKGRNQQGPTLSSRALAIVHIAIHDAYVLAKRQIAAPSAFNDPYLPVALRPDFNTPPAPNPKLVSAAVSAAASTVLLSLYPAQNATIEAGFSKICSINGGDEAGHRFGLQLARNVINLRSQDGSSVDPDPETPSYMDSAARGNHREDPLNRTQSFLGATYGKVRMFACDSFHGLDKYPDIGTALYVKHHREVRMMGASPSSAIVKRTPLETLQGIYWAYDGAKEIGTPPRLYNQIIVQIAKQKKIDEDQLNRLLLLINLAMADAGIHAWYYKYHFDLWRPIIGIREYDEGMGPGATEGTGPALDQDCDPFWRPLGAPKTNVTDAEVRTFTPPFPAYPSGHATFGAAAFHATRLFLKNIGKAKIKPDLSDDIAFEFVSDELNGKSIDADNTVRTRHKRKFAGLHEAIYENSISRIFLGVHWRFDGTSAENALKALNPGDMIGGVPLGLAIAEDIVGQATVEPSPAGAVPPA